MTEQKSNSSDSSKTTQTVVDPPRILLADDSVTIRAALVRAMPEGAHVTEAADGEEAWNILQVRDDIELLITDLEMPKLNGYGLLKRIRESATSRIANMPVIVVTGAEDTKAKAKAFAEGANDFISKQSDKIEITARVRAHHKLAQLIHELEESRKILDAQANTDALTKLTNRRAFFGRASEALALMRRHGEHFSVLMMDIDHFKSINDTYGHQCGDYVLLEVAHILAQNIRTNDVLARLGGEEFAIATPYTNRLAALVLAERLRKSVETCEFKFKEKRVPVTISLGIATLEKDAATDIDQLLALADKRLYVAKRRGRNRLCASDSGDVADDLVETVHPKLDDALTMIAHGNTNALRASLPHLLKKLLPLFALANEFKLANVDVAELEKKIHVPGNSGEG